MFALRNDFNYMDSENRYITILCTLATTEYITGNTLYLCAGGKYHMQYSEKDFYQNKENNQQFLRNLKLDICRLHPEYGREVASSSIDNENNGEQLFQIILNQFERSKTFKTMYEKKEISVDVLRRSRLSAIMNAIVNIYCKNISKLSDYSQEIQSLEKELTSFISSLESTSDTMQRSPYTFDDLAGISHELFNIGNYCTGTPKLEVKRFHNNLRAIMNRLKMLGIRLDPTIEPIFLHLFLKKLDPITIRRYIDIVRNDENMPTIDTFLKFLDNVYERKRPINLDTPATSFASRSLILSSEETKIDPNLIIIDEHDDVENEDSDEQEYVDVENESNDDKLNACILIEDNDDTVMLDITVETQTQTPPKTPKVESVQQKMEENIVCAVCSTDQAIVWTRDKKGNMNCDSCTEMRGRSYK